MSQPHDAGDDYATRPTVYAADALAGQVVMVTGGGSGMGRATAWLAARLGATVVTCGRTEEKLVAVSSAIVAHGHRADYIPLDIRNRDAVETTFDTVWGRYGRLDILVNSAGGQFPQAAIDFSENGWNSVINNNLNGTWNMMQTAARRWRDAGLPGSIVNIVVVLQGLHGVAHTCAARAGVIAVSQCVAVEWAPLKIRVNCIAPGAIETEGWSVYSAEARAKYPLTNPSMRVGSPWEIAQACVFLGSTAGSFVTGEVLTVDGGGHRWGDLWTTPVPEYFDTGGKGR